MTTRTTTRTNTNTQRHAALRQRKRDKGLQRRTVWLDQRTLISLELIKQKRQMTQDEAIAYALASIEFQRLY